MACVTPSARSGLVLIPAGRFHFEAATEDATEISDPKAAARIAAAFAAGDGAGVLHLGAVEVDTVFPSTAAWMREVGRLFVTRLCAAPDPESARAGIEVPCPLEELAALASTAPPFVGGEYLTGDVLAALWDRMGEALRKELAAFDGPVDKYLHGKNAIWNRMGRVCFHLAENRRDEEAPFAFVATYTARLSAAAKVQHLPLAEALREYAGARNKAALLSLLAPVQKAAETSDLARELVDTGAIYHPLRWTPKEAYRFLKDTGAFEASGVVVRVPDFWKGKHPPRPEARLTVGGKPKTGMGADAPLDFSVGVVLDGETLSPAEVRALLAGSDGLALVRGKWVEVDREKLAHVLDGWKALERSHARDGISFVEGLRLLAGARIDGGGESAAPDQTPEWSQVVPGEWLAQALAGLRSPETLAATDLGDELRAELRPYQKVGVRWLWWLQTLGLGGCLADDMGLGKTIQVIALLLLLKRRSANRSASPSLLCVPTSLIANWRAEIARFAPSIRVVIAHTSETPASELAARPTRNLARADLVITTYGTLPRLPWVSEEPWELVILDEAQAIKNPDAKQTRAVKKLRGRVRFALTGTPVENRLGDLWSLFDFLSPGLLGSPKTFSSFVKRLEKREPPSYAPLRELVRPYILRRLKTDRRIIDDLPDKTEMQVFCGLTKKQAALYAQAVESLRDEIARVDGIKRRGLVLAYLVRLKQICNHPSQWLGDGAWDPAASGKFARLAEIAEEIAAKQERALVFTQFREVTEPLAAHLGRVFGRAGLVLTGETAVKKRAALVASFQAEDGPPFFVLSLKAGGTGLNLTAATHVIHFDRWWNPAVENQATDRAFRIGQKRNVLVHKFVCRGTLEERIDQLIQGKQSLAREVLEGGDGAFLTEMGNEELLRVVSLDIHAAVAEA
jgi:superfamily II DNA or RNA helicase